MAASSTVAAADRGALEQRSQAVQSFFQERLGLSPADNTGAYLSYHIPATLEPALPDFLQELEAVGAELGVTDLNIGLTSLEEVLPIIRAPLQILLESSLALCLHNAFANNHTMLPCRCS